MRVAIVICAMLLSGCTSHTEGLNRAREAATERAQEFVAGTGDALQEADESDPAVVVASRLNRSAQIAVGGMPSERRRIDAHGLIQGEARAVKDLGRREQDLGDVVETRREHERALLVLGSQKEVENNKSLWRRLVASFGLLGAIGALVALGIFFPPALLLIGKLALMLVSWLVGKIPALVGMIGVVGKGAFDNVVKGIGDARAEFKKSELENPERFYTAAQVREILDGKLAIATDKSDKGLIDVSRNAQKV